jgi:tRNA A37 threonylcarbamoyladenosine dehydratase
MDNMLKETRGNIMITDYRFLFERNYGIFLEKEQERIRRSSILIIGCGGIGGTVALMLARSGVGKFILVEFDEYTPTNMNRQIACFTDTLGRNKAEVISENIKRINPEAEVEVHSRLLSHDEIAGLIPRVDIVFPAADDFAFSILVFRQAQRLNKPALFVVPSGTWANVSIITPDSPSVEDINGVPKLDTYEELKAMLQIRKYKLGTYFYAPIGNWLIDYYKGFVEGKLPPTQICPIVWLCSSIGALEVIKHLSGKWTPVTSPRYWYITKDKIRVNRINRLSLQTLLVWQRRLLWKLFQTPAAPLIEAGQAIWWRLFYRWYKAKQSKSSIKNEAGAR